MVDSKNQSAATSVESIASYHSKEVREVDCKNTEEQWSRLEKLKRRLKPGVRLILMVCILVHLGMFIVGTVRFNSCPINNNITFYLVSAGIVGAASKIITLIKDSVSEVFKFIKKLESVLYAAELVLFILGSQSVFSAFQPLNEQGFIDSCDKATYHLAFWILVAYYALLTTVILLFIIFIVSTWVLSGQKNKQTSK